MRGEHNKKYNRRITRRCPVCGGRVIIGNKYDEWWVSCEKSNLPLHIPQIYFNTPQECIDAWNNGEITG